MKKKQSSESTPRGSGKKAGTGAGGQGGYGKDGNPMPTPAEQDYEHGKGFPKGQGPKR
ncbi:MAG: hypothetical protein ABR537_00515 [Gemmatimonadales bacterium]